jgi:hypothetical protein
MKNTDSRFEGVQEDVPTGGFQLTRADFQRRFSGLSQNEISDKLGQLRNTETLKPSEVSP